MSECCVVQIPGLRGAPGTDGTDGVDGVNAFTFTTAPFTMPAVGASVDVSVEESDWIVGNGSAINGQVIHVQFAGYLFASSVPDSTSVELNNLGYDGNLTPGLIVPSGAKVSPGGLRGPSGAEVAGVLLAANDLSDVNDVPTALINLGIGTAGLLDAGVAGGEIAANDGALTAGEAVFATALGIETLPDLAARAALDLVKGIADTNTPQVDDPAGILINQFAVGTGAGLAGLTVAEAKTLLGVNSILFHANRNGANQGSIASGATTQIQFGDELFDVGGYYNIGTWRFQPLVAGYYQLDARVGFAAIGGGAATEYYVQIYKLGVLVASAHLPANTLSTLSQSLDVSTMQQADGLNDYFDVRVRQTSGFDATLNGNASVSYFTGSLIATV